MDKTYLILFSAGLLFPLTLISMEIGRRFGRRRLAEDPEGARAGAGAVEGAVFALFGLLIAFTFTSAASRFETRRDLIVQHTNAIGTAWLRLDLLPAEVQPAMRKDLRLYLDQIIKVHQQVGDREAVNQTMAYLGKLQNEIWGLAQTVCRAFPLPVTAPRLLIPLHIHRHGQPCVGQGCALGPHSSGSDCGAAADIDLLLRPGLRPLPVLLRDRQVLFLGREDLLQRGEDLVVVGHGDTLPAEVAAAIPDLHSARDLRPGQSVLEHEPPQSS
jgi:hypothetical protein